MNLETISYHMYEKGLPQEGNFILGQTRGENIIVYQAFNDRIADDAIINQKFGGPDYSFSRMTWIKPNFLWMMYRSGWATKEGQNRILAIEISKEGFFDLLDEGILTTFDHSFKTEDRWREALNKSNVRIQWDPDHNASGEKLKRRAVQVGIKGDALKKFNNCYIKSIQDISPFVKAQKNPGNKETVSFFVMNESIIDIPDALKLKFNIPDICRT